MCTFTVCLERSVSRHITSVFPYEHFMRPCSREPELYRGSYHLYRLVLYIVGYGQRPLGSVDRFTLSVFFFISFKFSKWIVANGTSLQTIESYAILLALTYGINKMRNVSQAPVLQISRRRHDILTKLRIRLEYRGINRSCSTMPIG